MTRTYVLEIEDAPETVYQRDDVMEMVRASIGTMLFLHTKGPIPRVEISNFDDYTAAAIKQRASSH